MVRGEKVILDSDIAMLFEVNTKVLKQAVRRNISRFPEDFMFELNADELTNLRSQIVTSSWGGIRYAPFAFTEQGVAALHSIEQRKSHSSQHRHHAGFRRLAPLCFHLRRTG